MKRKRIQRKAELVSSSRPGKEENILSWQPSRMKLKSDQDHKQKLIISK